MSKSIFCTATVPQAETIIGASENRWFFEQRHLRLDGRQDRDEGLCAPAQYQGPGRRRHRAGTGAVLGGTLGWLAGIGALAIPGLGPFIAAGPIMAALSGAALGGTVGGLTGALVGMGIPEFEAKRYEGKVKSGSCLISVHSDDSDETTCAKEICERAGAQDITTAGEVAVPSGAHA